MWHPLAATTDEVVAWRTRLRALEHVQPFKQAFREVYVLAPAERETRTYSNRFAAHVVRYPQVYALAKARGWGVRALGPYDNGGGRQWRDFEEQRLRVELTLDDAALDDHDHLYPIARLATTDGVRFMPLDEREAVPLERVPPVVFSEAMRDVDLFVGVASVAADPEWIDHGPERYHGYWREHGFGPLGETAATRREALADLLPALRFADRCTLEERYLVIRGDRTTYRIHLASANVLMDPDDRYLCIVPGRSRAPRVYLPFPDDERLAIILSKAAMLADDRRITDPTILAQIDAS
jgi:hypothetical protein